MNKNKKYTYFAERPHSQGLYDASKEHDSCGIGFVANIKGNKNHSIILDGLKNIKQFDAQRGSWS